MDGVLTAAEASIVVAAQRLGLISTSQWPMVAAHVVVRGVEDECVVELAGLPAGASPWQVDPLVREVVAVLGGHDMSVETAARIIARVVGGAASQLGSVGDFFAIRTLARLAVHLDERAGLLGDAYAAAEWLDCDCHAGSVQRADAVSLEMALRLGPPFNADPALLAAVTDGWL